MSDVCLCSHDERSHWEGGQCTHCACLIYDPTTTPSQCVSFAPREQKRRNTLQARAQHAEQRRMWYDKE